MVEQGILSEETERVLNILARGRPEPSMSLYDQAAHAVYLLRTEERLAPNDLFMGFFRLINAIAQLDWAATSLEDIAIQRWTYAADSQRFAFVTPSTNCDLIKKTCADGDLQGYAKVAAFRRC
jgi:hypothetical protein